MALSTLPPASRQTIASWASIIASGCPWISTIINYNHDLGAIVFSYRTSPTNCHQRKHESLVCSPEESVRIRKYLEECKPVIETDEQINMRIGKEWADIIIRYNLSSSHLSTQRLDPMSFTTRVTFLPGIAIMPSRLTLRFDDEETATLFINSIKDKVNQHRRKIGGVLI